MTDKTEGFATRRTSDAIDPAGVTPPEEVKMRTLRFADDGTVPNNPDLPAVILPGAVDAGADDAAITALYEANGWRRVWTYTVFDYHHYHPNAHEVLTVASGWADVMLGGPGGEIVRVAAGDAMVLPAGTGHCRVEASADFQVCGGYPPDQTDRLITRADTDPRGDAVARIAAVTRPETDPIYGADGPLLTAWATAG